MKNPQFLYFLLLIVIPQHCQVFCAYSPGDSVGGGGGGQRNNPHIRDTSAGESGHQRQPQQQLYTQQSGGGNVIPAAASPTNQQGGQQHFHAVAPGSGGQLVEHRNSYNLLSEAMSQAVSNEFSSLGSGSADGACHADDLECYSSQDRLSMEAIRTLHQQLDDDDNGNIDLSESDDFLRGELKYDSGYEKRQKAFHFNDDMHISVKELWEAWLRSEVHNWTIEQTTDWLAQSVQLPQYVEIFKVHKVSGAALPRLAVNNMHYVGNVLGIKDPIHKQKIALKAMDVVLFGPPRETGTRWKDYILVTLLLSAIIGCWYAYQQNKNAKRHLRRMAQDMEGLQRAEQSLQEMQKELERARMEQENVASEKMDLERRLKEAPSLSTSNSDLEVQQLKKEIEMLRTELSRAEIELVDNCWSPPPQLQQWLQYTYELESKNHQKKRLSAEKQLQSAREACEKLRKKRSSLVGAFVSTHGKSIDDVDRSIVEARNSLGEVTNELQERLHRWKQIEQCLGLNIVNNNGLQYLESVLYGRNNGVAGKGSRGRITNSTDDLDDESIQGIFDNYGRSSALSASGIINTSASNAIRDDSSCSDEGADIQSVHFYLGSAPTTPAILNNTTPPIMTPAQRLALTNENHILPTLATTTATMSPLTTSAAASAIPSTLPLANSMHANFVAHENGSHVDDSNSSRHSPSLSSECSVTAPPRLKKHNHPISPTSTAAASASVTARAAPLPPPRKSNHSPLLRSNSMDMMLPMELCNFFARPNLQTHLPPTAKDLYVPTKQMSLNSATANILPSMLSSHLNQSSKSSNSQKMMVKQHSTASQQSTSSSNTSSSAHSAPASSAAISDKFAGIWANNEPFLAHAEQLHDILDKQDMSKKSTTSLGTSVPPTLAKFINNSLSSQSLSSSTNTSDCGGDEVTKVEKRKRRLRFPFSHSGSLKLSSKKDATNESNKKKHA